MTIYGFWPKVLCDDNIRQVMMMTTTKEFIRQVNDQLHSHFIFYSWYGYIQEYEIETHLPLRFVKSYPLPLLLWKIIPSVVKDFARHTGSCSSLSFERREELMMNLRQAMAIHYLTTIPRLRRFRKYVLQRYRAKLHNEMVVARDRKHGHSDLYCPIRFHERSMFWMTAFYGAFKAGMENGRYIVYVNREGTSQQAVEIFCLFTLDRQAAEKRLFQYVYEESRASFSQLTRRLQEVQVLADKWDNPAFYECLMKPLETYIEVTLLHTKGTTSTQRLQHFVDTNPVLAEYIWLGNFRTETKRTELAVLLHISNRRRAGFVRAQTLNELREWLSKIQKRHIDMYDDLPLCMKRDIDRAKENLTIARKGVPVGLFGRYISSDAIQAAETRLNDLWKQADRYLGQQNLKRAREHR